MNYMRRWQKLLAGFIWVFFLSCSYLIYLFARVKTMHPEIILDEIIRDMAVIGPWAIVLDICFLLGVWILFRRWRKKQTSIC